MTADALIEKLEADLVIPAVTEGNRFWNNGLERAIAIVRTHSKPRDTAPGDGWRDIATAPKKEGGYEILGLYNDGRSVAVMYWDSETEEGWIHDCSRKRDKQHGFITLTHWMPLPLPTPPQKGG